MNNLIHYCMFNLGDNGSEGDVESDGLDDFYESEYEMEGNTSNLDDFEFDQNVDSTIECVGVEENANEPVGNEPVAGDEPFVNSWERNLDERNLSDDASLKDSDSDEGVSGLFLGLVLIWKNLILS